jgi:hypothetical protein
MYSSEGDKWIMWRCECGVEFIPTPKEEEPHLQKIGRLTLENIMAYYTPEELREITDYKPENPQGNGECKHEGMTANQLKYDRPCPKCGRRPFWDADGRRA